MSTYTPTHVRFPNEGLRERLQFETLLTDLSATFIKVAPDEIDQQIELGLQCLVEFLGVDRSSVGEFSEDRRELWATHSYVAPGFPPFPRVIVDDQLPWYTERLRRGEDLRFTRLPDELPPEAVREREYCNQSGLRSNLTLPLRVGGVVLGVLAFGSFRVERPWPDELVQRLRLVGKIFANALARKRADQALRKREARLRLLLESTNVIPWEHGEDAGRVRGRPRPAGGKGRGHARKPLGLPDTDFFTKRPALKVEAKTEAVRFLGRDTAVEEGMYTVRTKDSPAHASRYSALWVRPDG